MMMRLRSGGVMVGCALIAVLSPMLACGGPGGGSSGSAGGSGAGTGTGGASATGPNLVGEWDLTCSFDGGACGCTVTIDVQNASAGTSDPAYLKGSICGDCLTHCMTSVEGSLDGSHLTFGFGAAGYGFTLDGMVTESGGKGSITGTCTRAGGSQAGTATLQGAKAAPVTVPTACEAAPATDKYCAFDQMPPVRYCCPAEAPPEIPEASNCAGPLSHADGTANCQQASGGVTKYWFCCPAP